MTKEDYGIKFLEKATKDFIFYLRHSNYSSNTIKTYYREIEFFLEYFRQYSEEMDIFDINRPFIVGSLEFREKASNSTTVSFNTKKIYIAALYQFFVYLTDLVNGRKDFTYLFRNIKIQIEKKQKQYLTQEEVNRLLNYIKPFGNTFLQIRNKLMIKFLLFAGLRVSELLGLKISDITTAEEDKNVFKIRVFGKGRKEAFCYIDRSKIEDDLEEFLRIRRRFKINSDYLFISKTNRVLRRDEVYKICTNALKKAGIDKKGVHIFRHTLGFILAQKGVRIEDIQDILRHSNINTTRIYVQRTEKDIINTVKKL